MIIKCPVCHIPIEVQVELKTRVLSVCLDHGMFEASKKELDPTKLTPYPCPECNGNYKIPDYHQNGYAICTCEIHGTFKTNVNQSLNFRRFCSEIARKPNKSPHYFTPPEKKVRSVLDELGILWEHNKRFPGPKKGVYYYPDFVIEDPVKLIIGVDPSIWHSRWNRLSSDKSKLEFFRKQGYYYLSLSEDQLKTKASIKEYLELLIYGIPIYETSI